ncbi:DNA-binding transcriptional LysR family regulator [Rhizobium tibeticum]|uniref:HTH-type transcriptional regulator TtuA n=1 Tax=Rhizobium tibeticum TaxID=501024 RepID=A0A1H8GHG2_9HYPH|nr:LysR family transcriptional regulator [Rhizobium tibeticum]MDP9808615.1 DNA-binding transcriptional LysR family regulator [Rhizobium tibeticum]SEH61707.1 D-malate degradation protein R [Rhizobium tibeticum]SEN43230.1 transcriptional regulator, LysR family [Rhizobium tibeticum]
MKRVRSTDLAIFLAIAHHRSFRKASVELGVTASALSHALRAIEERLEVRLVNRTTRGVALTEAGERLFDRIRPAFLDIDAALEDLNSFRGQPYGKLRINAARASTKLVLLPIVSRFLKAYPSVEVEIVIDDALVDTVSSGFDAGVRFGESVAADMIAVRIGPRHRFAVVAAPSYFENRAKPVTPRDLRDHECIRYRFAGGAFYRWEFERGGIELEIEVAGPLTLGDQDIILDAVLHGCGLGYLFEEQVQSAVADGRLIRVLEDWCPFYPGFFLYYPSRRQLPTALRAFVDFVKVDRAPPQV